MKSLKKSINDFISFLKKRYQLIPWSQIQKVHKIDFDEDTRITVGEKEYSVDELLKKIKETQSSLRSKQKMSYFHHYVKEFLQDSKSKMSIDVKKIYTEYDDKLDTEFKDTKDELMFCLNSLKEINKTLKSRENYKKESEDFIMDYFNLELFKEGLNKSEVQDILIDAYESFFDDTDLHDDLDVVEEGANLEYMKKVKEAKKLFRIAVKDYKKAVKVNDFERAKKDIASMNKILEDSKKEIETNADTLPQRFIGAWITTIIVFGKGILLTALSMVPIVGGIASTILAIREIIKNGEELNQGFKTIKKDSSVFLVCIWCNRRNYFQILNCRKI